MNYGKYIAQFFSFKNPNQVASMFTADRVAYMATWIEEQLKNGDGRIEIQIPIIMNPEKIPTKAMTEQAELLNEGPTIALYNNGTCIHMETRDGVYPYVWHKGKWVSIDA